MFESAFSQELKTDLYLFEFEYSNDSFRIEDGLFLNNFYKSGYNNQASFFSPNLVYLSSGFESNSTDIVALDISRKRFWKVTETLEAEYSPNKIPSSDLFSVVRVEKDDKTQSLWSYPIDQNDNGRRLLPQIDNVGYYCWINESKLALFLVDEPNRLVFADLETNTLSILAENIGRCLKMDSRGNLYFIQRNEENELFLKKYTPETKKLNFITKCPYPAEDFEFLDDEHIIIAEGSKLFAYKLQVESSWIQIGDFSAYGIMDISRVSISNNALILVNKK